ncbi:MAG TPA: T9SS type A sorting domain-containing protein [Fulvivirga sp.]|nr:T9SS type A sorting domain-containing protein [Fulvivirga sp.]
MKPSNRNSIAKLSGLALILSIALFGIVLSLKKKDKVAIQFLDGPDKALLQNAYMIKDPNENRIPYERLKQLRSNSSFARNQEESRDFNWKNIDTEYPGRSRALYFQSTTQTLYSGAITGGLWKNTDYKSNSKWENIIGFNGVAVNCIAPDPNDENIIYIGTGESFTAFTNYRESTGLGNGIFKSTDGGTKWDRIDATDGFYYVNDLVVRNEEGVSVLYAAVGSGEYRGRTFVQEGLYRSADQGNTWSQVLPKIPGSEELYQVADIEIASNGRMFLGTMRNSKNNGGSIVLYSDDAVNWNVYNGFNNWVSGQGGYYAGRSLIKAAPSNPNHIYAVFSMGSENNLDQLRDFYTEIWQSLDGGLNWSMIPSSESIGVFSLPWHAMALAIDPNNENKIIVGGLDVYVLNDASSPDISYFDWIYLSNWASKFYAATPGISAEEKQAYLDRYVHADIHDIQFIGGSSDEVLITTDGGVFYSSNMGLTNSIDPENPVQEFPVFKTPNNGLNTSQYYYASLHPGKGRMEFIGGLQDNGSIYKNFTTGVNNEQNISGGDGGYSFFDSDNDNLKITTVYGNRFYIHIGNTTYSYGIINGLFVNPMDYDDESNLIYSNTATSSYGGLYTSLKGRYYDTLEVINVNKYLVTDDLGLDTLEFVKLNAGLEEAITAIRLVRSSAPLNKTAIIGTENGQVFKVEGLPYEAISTKIDDSKLPIGYISSIDVGSDVNTILVTISNFGLPSVWITTDGGSTWSDIERNLPDMPVRWGRLNPSDDNKVIIATEMGVWGLENVESENEEWKSYNIGLPLIRVDMIDLRASDNTILAATHGQGIFIGNYRQDGIEVVGVDQNQIENNKILFYPNPVKDVLYVPKTSGISNVKVFDMQGKLVLSSLISPDQSINVGTLATGTFIVKGYDVRGKEIALQKIIRTR